MKETTEIKEGKLFSPGNLRATFDNPEYEKLINYYVSEKYTLRYTGGMVPDVNQVPHPTFASSFFTISQCHAEPLIAYEQTLIRR